MSGSILVSVLGPTVATVDGRLVTIPGAPQRTLLARLALAPGRVVSDDALLDALWPGAPPANATGNLQSYVSRLRRVVGPAVVAREPLGYRLDVAPDAIDVTRFEALARRARQLADEDPAAAVEAFAAALALWRGEPFTDVTDPLAFGPERARLEVLHRQARAGWLEARVSAGDADGALADLEQAVAAAPGDEAAHLVLVRALHLLGRTADGLRVATELRRRTVDETGLDPSPALAELEARLLADDPTLRPATAHRPPPEPVPSIGRQAPADRFVGRERELADVADALVDRQLVTVVAAGGAGKTRLVQELVDRGGAGDAVVVELASVTSSEDIVTRVAAALGVRAAPEGAESAVRDQLAHRQTTLVLDNCEHVVEGVVSLVDIALRAGPHVRVVATSRVRLGIAGEQVVRLGPLAADDQVRLFCDRAALQRPGFAPDERDRVLVDRICEQLDGLPLALELAARREAVFGLAQLADQLADGLEAIEPGDDEGGRGVVSTVGWSYRLLRPGAQALFDRLGACRGGFTLDALDELAPTGARNPAGALAELVDASLVEVDLTADPPRYRLLEVMRRVALAHLDEPAAAEARRAHRRWVLRHVERCFALQCERSPRSITLLRRELPNVLAALVPEDRADLVEVGRLAALVGSLAADDPHLEISDRLQRLEVWSDGSDEPAALCALGAGAAAWLRGDSQRAAVLLDRAVTALPPGHPWRWAALCYHTSNALFLGDASAVEEDADLVLADPAVPPWARAAAVGCAVLVNLYLGDEARARRWAEDQATVLDEVRELDAFVPFVHGELAASTDPHAALRWYEESLRTSEVSGQVYNQQIAAIGRAAVLVRLDRRAEGAAACADAADGAARLGMWPQVWTTLRLASELLVTVGEAEAAAILLTAAAHDPLAPEVLDADRARYESLWRVIRDQLPDDQLADTIRTGTGLDRATVVARSREVLARHA